MTNTDTTRNTAANPEISPSIERALENLLNIGKIWASHGLEMGRSALEASAESLKLASKTLDDVKAKIAPDDTKNA